ncbi:amidase [Sphingobium sp. BHU LFT2]|uniref:amidase n=1 Tax=Sphingobium sp. BHU LFT2 TaxID=2807634 RepID=UPI001BECEF2A|nr:amidase [Sphingobium sp. BHU LFT2]MBT2246738.1 amidase [Sphingobium sp. BHU LFT2]
MTLVAPTPAELADIAASLHMTLPPHEVQDYHALVTGFLADYQAIDAQPDEVPELRYPRAPGYRPDGAESCGNAWYWKATIEGAPTGKLLGKTIAIKDNINVAQLPMMNGSATLEGFVPGFDATVVTRVLDAGATILGKATCEHFCLSGGSHTSDPAPVHNPRRAGYSAGGSSSGSAALVAAGEVDMALGTDQGGSVRIPSAFCGVVGMKPTHGLVPYTGLMPIEATVDHCGPITRTVGDNALLLEVLAGPDGMDPRQRGAPTQDYTAALDGGARGLRIGLVEEGFALPNMMPAVADKVRAAARRFEQLGATVESLSVPEHQLATALWTPIGCEGLLAQMMIGNGGGHNSIGLQDVALIDHHARWREQADALSPSLKLCMMVGAYGQRVHAGRYHAKAQNIRLRVKRSYERLFASYDLLLMPTLPIVASRLPNADAPVPEIVARALEMIGNTAAYDVTGNPALSLPCGTVDGLPVGLMLVAGDHREAIIYQAAAAYERAVDWEKL